MLRKRLFFAFSLLIIASMVLASCQTKEVEKVVKETVEKIVTQVVEKESETVKETQLVEVSRRRSRRS